MAKSIKTLRNAWIAVAQAVTKVSERVHILACDTLEHVKEHGDLSLCSFAVNSLWKTGVHRRALIQWFQRHARCRATVVDGKIVFVKKAKADLSTIDVEAARLDPFYVDDNVEGKTEEDASWDAFRALKSVVNKQRKIIRGEHKRFTAEKSKLLPQELLEAIENYIGMYEGKDPSDRPMQFSHSGGKLPETTENTAATPVTAVN